MLLLQLDAVRKKMPEMSGGDAEEMKTLMADLKELVDLSKGDSTVHRCSGMHVLSCLRLLPLPVQRA